MQTLTAFMRMRKTIVIIFLSVSLAGCYHYRVLNTVSDPATEYQKRTMWSYAWGLVNKPKDLHVMNCDSTNAIDEIVYTKNFGHCMLTLITLGIASPVEVKWKCHKPCAREGDGF
jgi:hypothetical protein